MKRIKVLLFSLILMFSIVACGKAAADGWQEQYDLGMRYLTEGNYEEAILAFTMAIEIDPKMPEAYLGAAEAYVALDDMDAAIKILEMGVNNTESDELKKFLNELKENISSEEVKSVLDPYYTYLSKKDYVSLYHIINNEFVSKNTWYVLEHPELTGICYDGSTISADLTGIGMKIIDGYYYYYGSLEKGTPTGEGICFSTSGGYTDSDLFFYRVYEGEWSYGLPNGDGFYTQMIANTGDEQCKSTLECKWNNGLINGEVIDKDYIEDILQDEFHYMAKDGKMVLDDRWVQKSNGDYVLPSVYSIWESPSRKSFQPEFVQGFLN